MWFWIWLNLAIILGEKLIITGMYGVLYWQGLITFWIKQILLMSTKQSTGNNSIFSISSGQKLVCHFSWKPFFLKIFMKFHNRQLCCARCIFNLFHILITWIDHYFANYFIHKICTIINIFFNSFVLLNLKYFVSAC